jgi:ribosomal protein L12E/L44/L45/RPP1/RPP2
MKRTTVSDRKSLNRLLTEAAANTARLPVGGKAAPKTQSAKQHEHSQRPKSESSDKQEPS